ncbi:hypothetical protein B0H94_108151 [Salsuginibacillus halophilus]|uniref:Phosphotransferase system EIIC domain-containing protein n=1 Tax=Salsuginibacillus halophilus TaxID=517424 RepID=A0A2P8HE80_9BACI|nr:PTS sugar transporter subunit IIC [Salsuginibacillus halophilus]PSL44538.1 hypothetical protein B0H94_108151 [Salsuginibacillus halophilus]
MQEFLKRKDIEVSFRAYILTALSYMALGLFSSLIIGLIIETIGEQLGIPFFVEMGTLAMSLVGPAVGAGIAYGLKAPPLVAFAALAAGAAGNELGGPAGAYAAALLAVEFGKVVSKETRIDILVTPFVTILIGFVTASLIGPVLDNALRGFGGLVNWATTQQPLIMGILVAAFMGIALTAPISSAAIAIMLDLSGLAAGAATVGCTAQMVGFAVSSYRDNGVSGLAALGVGTSMLQVPNVVRKPLILIPPTLAGALAGPVATVWLQLENNAEGAGMGSSGFVGQIMTFSVMGFSTSVAVAILAVHFVMPAVLSFAVARVMFAKGWLKPGDMKIEQG